MPALKHKSATLLLILAAAIGYTGELLLLHNALATSDARTSSYVFIVVLCLGASLAAATLLTRGVKRGKVVFVALWTAALAIAMSAALFSIESVYLG